MDFLQKLDIDMIAVLDAICDDNLEKSYKVICENPTITKNEFLKAMNIKEYAKNTIPHPYRNYGDGKFNRDKMFNDIKAYVKKGNDVNSFFDNASVLYHFLDHYYQLIIYDPIVDDENGEDDEYAEELLLPFEKRSYDIKSQIQWLLDNGADPNAGGEYLPLMIPVSFLDPEMTELLLKNGANPHYDIESNSETPYGCGNYYIDDLDATALHHSFEDNPEKVVFDQILKIATLFATYGVTDVHTHCISIDGEKRTVNVTQAKAKY